MYIEVVAVVDRLKGLVSGVCNFDTVLGVEINKCTKVAGMVDWMKGLDL